MTQNRPVSPESLTETQIQAGVGSLIGMAVGDALGAPFEFKPKGSYAMKFPKPVMGGRGELVGGGSFGWAPGEFTDDSQLALALTEAILANDGDFDEQIVWNHFKAWAKNATDIGLTTRQSLEAASFRGAAQAAHEILGFSGGNGGVMRVAPIGIFGVGLGRSRTIDAAFRQAALTHFDPVACWSASIVAETVRQLILGETFDEAISSAVQGIDASLIDFFTELVDKRWHPEMVSISNGTAHICLAQAIWSVRNTDTFEGAVVEAINLGDDADTVAAVTGSLAGALYGIGQIPSRWVTYLHGKVNQPSGGSKTYFQHDLVLLSYRLLGRSPRPFAKPEPVINPTYVHDVGIQASNILGAANASAEMGIISLCRTEDRLHKFSYRREFYLIDDWEEDSNPHLSVITEDVVNTIEAFLREGREVLVHCHGGRSRTGFILKAWYMRRYHADHEAAEVWIRNVWSHYTTWNTVFFQFLQDEWSL